MYHIIFLSKNIQLLFQEEIEITQMELLWKKLIGQMNSL